MKPRLYLDEGIHGKLAEALRDRGIDASNFAETGHQGASDLVHFNYAVLERRTLVTYDVVHFQSIAVECFKTSRTYWGIVVSPQFEFGEMLRRLVRLCDLCMDEDLKDQIIYLQSVR